MSLDNTQSSDEGLENYDFQYPCPDPIAPAVYFDMLNHPGPSAQHASHNFIGNGNNTPYHGLQIPTFASAAAGSHLSLTEVKPKVTTEPTDPTHAQMSGSTFEFNQPNLQAPLRDILGPAIRHYDDCKREWLRRFESSLKHLDNDSQTRANGSFVNKVNTNLVGLQSAIANKLRLEAFASGNEQQDEQCLLGKLGSWKEEILDDTKAVINQTNEEFLEKVRLLMERSSICCTAATHFPRSLEEKVIEQHVAIKSVEKELSSITLKLLNRLESLDARFQSVVNILSAAASNLAACTSSSALSAVSALSLDGASDSLADTASTLESSLASASSTTADILPASGSMAQSPCVSTEIPNHNSLSKAIVVQLVETSTVAADILELSSTGDMQSEKLEKMSRMDTAQDESISNEFRVSKTTASADDATRAHAENTPAINADSTDSNGGASRTASVSPVSHAIPKAVEDKQEVMLQQQEQSGDPGK